MAPAALSYLYCTTDDLDALASVEGVEGRVNDQATSYTDSIGALFVDKAISWATGRINMHLMGRYAPIDLAASQVVNFWCVVLTMHILSMRRGNPHPASYADEYKETMDDLRQVRDGSVNLNDTATRTSCWPTWSNVRVNCFYQLRKARVERPISESTPMVGPFRQQRDVGADYTVEPN